MKHATSGALDRVEWLLGQMRGLSGLRERKRGIFYRKSRAFAHFHESGDHVYLDARLADDFERLPVTTRTDQKAALERLRQALASGASS